MPPEDTVSFPFSWCTHSWGLLLYLHSDWSPANHLFPNLFSQCLSITFLKYTFDPSIVQALLTSWVKQASQLRGYDFFSMKGQIINILGFEDHTQFPAMEMLHIIHKRIITALSSTILFMIFVCHKILFSFFPPSHLKIYIYIKILSSRITLETDDAPDLAYGL